MSLPCLGPTPDVLPDCEPTCVRWSGINRGQPITIFHDTSGYDIDFYPNLANDPDIYLRAATALWEEEYPCGTLFEFVDTPSEASLIVVHEPEIADNPCAIAGSATCFCDGQDEICERVFDHSAFFNPTRQAIMTLFMNPCSNAQGQVQYTNTMLHELGHILGMGHVSGLPSIMGPSDRVNNLQLYPFDIEQLQNRYPCGCNVTETFAAQFQQRLDMEPDHSGTVCPGCLERPT